MTWTKHKVIVWFVVTWVSLLNVDIVQLKTPFNIVIDIIIGCTYFDLAWFLWTRTSSKHTHNTSPNGINTYKSYVDPGIFHLSTPICAVTSLGCRSKRCWAYDRFFSDLLGSLSTTAVNLYNPLKTKTWKPQSHGGVVQMIFLFKRVTFWFMLFFGEVWAKVRKKTEVSALKHSNSSILPMTCCLFL